MYKLYISPYSILTPGILAFLSYFITENTYFLTFETTHSNNVDGFPKTTHVTEVMVIVKERTAKGALRPQPFLHSDRHAIHKQIHLYNVKMRKWSHAFPQANRNILPPFYYTRRSFSHRRESI